MNKCLLCHERLPNHPAFSSLYFLKQENQTICTSCRQVFELITELHCPNCYKEGASDACYDCRYWEKTGHCVDHISLYQYNEAMARYFSQYKFQGDYLLRKVFGKEFKLVASRWKEYTLVPVPISDKRLEERGFNQVIGILEAAGLPYQELLQKEERDKQSSKTRKERLGLDQPFSITTGSRIPEHILLVDDIYTTGATLMRAKEILLESGAKKIKTISLAR